MNKDIEEIQEKTRSVFSGQEKLGIAYLYGSRSRGESDDRSDYDFAVYFDEHNIVNRYDMLAKLIADLSQALGTDAIDVKSINDIKSLTLKYHILKEGIVMFEREPFRVVIEPRILNEYFDHRFLLEKYGLTHSSV